jgi:hypothetical protein
MATQLIGERREGNSGGFRKQGANLIYVHRATLLVYSDDRYENKINVLTTLGLPIVGQSYGGFVGTCVSKDCDRSEVNPHYWDVKVEFSTGEEEQKQNPNDPNNPNPTTWIPIYDITFETYQEAATKDNAGAAILNTAGIPFAEPLMRSRVISVLDFYQFEPDSLTLDAIMDRNDTVNSVTFRSIAAWKLNLLVRKATLGTYNNFPCWRIEYQLKYRKDNWKDKIVSHGTQQKVSGQLVPCVNARGQTIDAGLTSAGVQVGVGVDPHVMEKEIKEAIDFNSFLRF